MPQQNTHTSLYQESQAKDNCGFGLIANMDDKPSSWIIDTSIEALNRLKHRGAVSDDGKSSDGCGLLIKKPNEFLHFCFVGVFSLVPYRFQTFKL